MTAKLDPSGGVGRGWLAAVGLTAAAAMGLQVLAGHAAAASALRSVNLLAQWLHLLAAGVWAGGLVWLLAGLLSQPPQAIPTRGDHQAATVDRVQAVIRFSRLALPVVGVLAATGLNRALDLAGGWSGLARTGFGRVLDLKLLLFGGLLVLAARNRYRLLPTLTGPAARLGALRRSVTGEIALVAAVLLAAALLTQLPPGKFALPPPPDPAHRPTSRSKAATRPPRSASPSPPPPAPPAPTRSPPRSPTTTAASPTPPNASPCALALRGRPEISGATLELARANDGSWQATGSQLSIDGRWDITALVQGPGAAVTVPLQLRTRTAEPKVTLSTAPGQPDLYTITAPSGASVQAYVDPGRPGANTAHFTFFTKGGSEQPIEGANATMTTPLGQETEHRAAVAHRQPFRRQPQPPGGIGDLHHQRHPREGPPITASFTQQIK